MKILTAALLLFMGAATLVAQQVEGGNDVVTRLNRAPDSKGPLPVWRSGKWGFVSTSGAMTIAPQFDEADFFYDGRAAVRANGLWGYIDATGHVTIPPRFLLAARFSDDLAAVRWVDSATGKTVSGYVDTSGQVAITCNASNPDEHLTAARCGRAFSGGFVAEAIEVFRCLDEPGNPREYPCKATLIDRWGYYDKAGKLAIAGPFHSGVGPFADGLASVQRYGERTVGFIESSGAFVIAPQYDQALAFSEGLSAARRGSLWGFIDRSGQVVIDVRFQSASTFSEGMAAIRENGRWGYIDRTGRIVIPPRFEEASPFSEGLAAVCCDGGNTRYIDSTGQWAFATTLPRGVSTAGPYIGGIALVDTAATGPAYIDRTGRVVALVRTRN